MGLKIFQEIKDPFGVPIITDIHEPVQRAPVAEGGDVIQLLAFLARQTDLVVAMAKTGTVINIKEPQFLAPYEMKQVITQFKEAGNECILLCEQDSSFGYNNLVVDMLGIGNMQPIAPVIFDAIHALQRPGGLADSAGGRQTQAFELARSGMALCIAGLFLEAHLNPAEAKCDGRCVPTLDKLGPYLLQMKAVDDLVKSFEKVIIE